MTKHMCVTLVPLFDQLHEIEQAQINDLVFHKVYQKGEQIIQPAEDPRLVIIARGRMKVYQLSANGKEQLLRVIEPGQYEGESELFGAVNETLYGEAMEKTEVCVLRHQDFQQLLLKYPQLSLRLLEINAEKMLKIQQQTSFLMMENLEKRLATYLLDLAKAEASSSFDLPMKMKELAAFLGTTPETLSRKFKVFEGQQLLTREKRHIRLLDQDQLEDYLI